MRNHLARVKKLRNTFYLMRHAHSMPNERGIIVSDPVIGNGPDHGLSIKGVVEAELSAARLPPAFFAAKTIVVVTSFFTRHMETSEAIVQRVKRQAGNRRFPELHYSYTSWADERHFGQYDMGPHTAYSEVWERDTQDPRQSHNGMESVQKVLDRMTRLVIGLDRQHTDASIIIVSSGDPVRTLEGAFARLPLGQHRTLRRYVNAEVRLMRLGQVGLTVCQP